MSKRALVAAVALAVSATAGCTAPLQRASERHHQAGHATHRPSASASGSPSPSEQPSEQTSEQPSDPTSPLVDVTAPAGTPLGAGQRVWVAFTTRGLSQHAWWAKLRPLLSNAAQATYVYDDPRNLPPMTMTGQLHVAPKPPAEPRFSAEVVAPTSKGVFRLDLERHKIGSPWLLYAIKFPPAVQ